MNLHFTHRPRVAAAAGLLSAVLLAACSSAPTGSAASASESSSQSAPAVTADAGKVSTTAATGGSPATLETAGLRSSMKDSSDPIAVIVTSKGTIRCELFAKLTPLTVQNFIGLATGKKAWTDPNTEKETRRPLYNGTLFHRVIPKFMIQGGDPLGNGTGGPGYQFKNETNPDLVFDAPGKLAMANAGPDTNGSQFFITVAPAEHLNGGYSLFGKVLSGQSVANAISQVPRDANDRPLLPVTIQKITIETPGSTGSRPHAGRGHEGKGHAGKRHSGA